MSADQKFTIGMRYWNQSGESCELLAITQDGRFVIAPEIEVYSYDGPEISRGAIVIVDKLYIKPPTDSRDKEILDLDAQIKERGNLLGELAAEIRTAQKERMDLIKHLSDVPALRHIDDFISGRMTHLVLAPTYGGNIVVETTDEALRKGESGRDRDGKLRLLTLFGDSKRNLNWMLNSYSDGSGDWSRAFPYTSEEDARAKAQELILDGIEESLAKQGFPHNLDSYIKSANKLGIPIPQAATDRLNEATRLGLTASIAKMDQERAVAQARLDAITKATGEA